MRHDAHEQNKLGHSHMAGPNRTVHPQRPPGMHSTPRVSHHPNTLPHHQNFQQNPQYIRPPRVNQIPGTQQLPRAGMSVNHAANGRVDNFNQRRSSGVSVTIKPKSPVATQPHQHMPQQFNQKNIKPFVSRASVQQSKPIERMKSNPMSFERSSSINSLHDQDFGSLHSPIKLNLTVTPPPQSSFLSEVASLVTHDALPMLQSPLLMESLSDRQHHSPEITPLPIKSPSLSSADSGFGTGVNRNPDQNNSAVKPDPGANLSPPPLLDFNEFIKQEAAEEDDTLKFLEDEKPDAVVEELVMTLAQEQKQDQKSPETPTNETTPPTNEASPDNETSPISENV
uniref:Uncharacterized protein n=1 Tax=Ciona savignyi TaxID=51511 RepID=H2YZJ2_CIOSA